jgi:hypothetical protein
LDIQHPVYRPWEIDSDDLQLASGVISKPRGKRFWLFGRRP